MKQHGYLGNVLLSHDGDSYYGDGECRPYRFLFTDLIALLKDDGLSDQEIRQVTVDNPRRAFTVAMKPLN